MRGRVEKRSAGGSRPGRRPNRDRNFELGAHFIMRDYFGVGGEPPVYSERDVKKRNRMPQAVFKRLYTAVRKEPWWRRSINATGRPQSYPIQKLLATARVLGYGEPYDRHDEYCRLSQSTIAEATRHLTNVIVDKWEATYLRRLTEDQVKHILTRNAARGTPGCIGSIDCTHWHWLKCPKALAGQYHSRKGKRSAKLVNVLQHPPARDPRAVHLLGLALGGLALGLVRHPVFKYRLVHVGAAEARHRSDDHVLVT